MKRALVLSILPFAFATVGWAAVVTNFQTFTVDPEWAWASVEAQTNFPVSNSDLINEGSPFLSRWEGIGYTPCPIESYGPLSALINGNAGGSTGFRGGLPTPEGVLDIADGAWTFVVSLNTVIAPLGYDITRVETFTGHMWGNRKSQAYTLLVSRVGDESFEAIGSFERSLFNWNGGSTVLTISDSEGVISSGVDAIRWDVYAASVLTPGIPYTSRRIIARRNTSRFIVSLMYMVLRPSSPKPPPSPSGRFSPSSALH